MVDAILTLDDVEMFARPHLGNSFPQVGETWVMKNGKLATVYAITANQFGPLDVVEHATGRVSHRTRDGRYAIMGHRGACDEDLMTRVGDAPQSGGKLGDAEPARS